jgi:methyl-accepting chemotaxis protein
VEVETLKKTQMKANLEVKNLGERSGITDVNITNRIQEIEERISGVEDTIEKIDTNVKENSKHKKTPNPKHPGNSGIRIEENKGSQLKGPENVNKS